MPITTNLHAHIERVDTGCDGTYVGKSTVFPTEVERAEEFGDIHFGQRVLNSIANVYSFERNANLRVVRHDTGTPDEVIEMEWTEPTDEGSCYALARICQDPRHTPEPSVQRDLRAEQAGY